MYQVAAGDAICLFRCLFVYCLVRMDRDAESETQEPLEIHPFGLVSRRTNNTKSTNQV